LTDAMEKITQYVNTICFYSSLHVTHIYLFTKGEPIIDMKQYVCEMSKHKTQNYYNLKYM